MTRYTFWTMISFIAGAVLLTAVPAFANAPVEWGLGLQEPASSSAQRINDFHDLLLIIITGIVIFVFLLLVFVVLRYNRFVNKTPSKTTHNVLLEILWTAVPVVILIIVAIPSFKILYKNDRIEDPEMTIKVVGYQWYWGYEYPDHGDIAFSSYMVPEAELKSDQKRLLSTDNVVVLPVDTNISILVTANDVIHAWTIPAFGVKIDAVPLKTNETWVRIDKPGVYYGQCSELCGKDHSFMPIEVWAVPKNVFAQWVEMAQTDIDSADIRQLVSAEALNGN